MTNSIEMNNKEKSMFKRVIWIVIDSVGIGALPDASRYGDEGADTLGHIFETYKEIKLDNMIRLGLTNICNTTLPRKCDNPVGIYGKVKEISAGKDTTMGHLEMIGEININPFPTYPKGFDNEIIEAFVKECNIDGVLGNCPASGTEIIKEYGKEHIETKKPIVYTSVDSVFQIACHEDVYSNEELYEMCKIARKILVGKHNVARVIARPFTGGYPYTRTAARRDFSLKPSDDNALCLLKNAGYSVAAVGKIEDIFAGSGITEAVHTKSNSDGVDKTLEYMKNIENGLIFTNLVDFDTKYGHRRDICGYKDSLEEFDTRLSEIIEKLNEDDLLIINADHGCDPAYKGTDHTREYIPLLIYSKNIKKSIDLGIRECFADIGATICENFNVGPLKAGSSFLEIIEEACHESV